MKPTRRLSLFIFMLLLSRSFASEKIYKPDSKMVKKAHITINGKFSQSSGLSTSKQSVLQIYKKVTECKYTYLGAFKVTGKKSTTPLAIEAGVKYFFVFNRIHKENNRFRYGIGISIGGNKKTTDTEQVFLTPKEGYVYEFRYDEKEKDFIDFSVIERDAKYKETELDIKALQKTSCSKIEGVDEK